MVLMVGSPIPPLPPESTPPQILSTTFKAEGVRLDSEQLQELKVLAMEWDKQRSRVMVDEDWLGLVDCTKCLF